MTDLWRWSVKGFGGLFAILRTWLEGGVEPSPGLVKDLENVRGELDKLIELARKKTGENNSPVA